MKIEWYSWSEMKAMCGGPFRMFLALLGMSLIAHGYDRGKARARHVDALYHWEHHVESAGRYNRTLSSLRDGPSPGSNADSNLEFARRVKQARSPQERSLAYLDWTHAPHVRLGVDTNAYQVVTVLRDLKGSPERAVRFAWGWRDIPFNWDEPSQDLPYFTAVRDFLLDRGVTRPMPARPLYQPPSFMRSWFTLLMLFVASLNMMMAIRRSGRSMVSWSRDTSFRYMLPANLSGWMVVLFFLPAFVGATIVELLGSLIGYLVFTPAATLWRFFTQVNFAEWLKSLLFVYNDSPSPAVYLRTASDPVESARARIALAREQLHLVPESKRVARLALIEENERVLERIDRLRANAIEPAGVPTQEELVEIGEDLDGFLKVESGSL